MNLSSIPTQILVALVLMVGCLLGGYGYGHHEGTQAGAAALAKYKATQAQAVADATQAAQKAQGAADAAMLAQQQQALAQAQAAAQQREAVVTAQAARVRTLEQALQAIPSSDKDAATWLGPLPPSIHKALNAGGAP